MDTSKQIEVNITSHTRYPQLCTLTLPLHLGVVSELFSVRANAILRLPLYTPVSHVT